MSLSEPLAWPFHQEQLEAIARRIREWNGSQTNKIPAAEVSWNSSEDRPEIFGHSLAAAGETTAIPDDAAAASQIGISGDGLQQPPDEVFPEDKASLAAAVSYDASDRSVSFESLADAWGSDDPDAGGAVVVDGSSLDPASESASPSPFVPAFERDEEDDSELDIKPAERARIKEDSGNDV